MIPPVIVPVTFKEIVGAIKDSAIGGKDKITEFKQEISRYNNCEHSILTYSGRTALYVLLKAYGLKKSDEIIMPAYMCETVSRMLLDMGFKLDFVDVDPSTYNIDIDDLNKRIRRNTKAILAVHMFGYPCDMQAIMDIAQEKGSIVIEDAAQAMGAEYRNKKVGSIAEAGFFSFGRGKPITAMGGGAIVTDDNDIARKCRTIVRGFEQKSSDLLTLIQLMGYSSLRNRAIYNIVHKKVRSEEFRTNINLNSLKFQLTNLQAAIGIMQLNLLNEFNTKRENNAEFFMINLKNIDGISMPKVLNNSKPIFLRFPIQIKDTVQRDRLMRLLEKHGIETSIVYPIPLPRLYNANVCEYTGAKKVTDNIIALPAHPIVNKDDIDTMVQIFKSDLT
jgi:perosamine synthetase